MDNLSSAASFAPRSRQVDETLGDGHLATTLQMACHVDRRVFLRFLFLLLLSSVLHGLSSLGLDAPGVAPCSGRGQAIPLDVRALSEFHCGMAGSAVVNARQQLVMWRTGWRAVPGSSPPSHLGSVLTLRVYGSTVV